MLNKQEQKTVLDRFYVNVTEAGYEYKCGCGRNCSYKHISPRRLWPTAKNTPFVTRAAYVEHIATVAILKTHILSHAHKMSVCGMCNEIVATSSMGIHQKGAKCKGKSRQKTMLDRGFVNEQPKPYIDRILQVKHDLFRQQIETDWDDLDSLRLVDSEALKALQYYYDELQIFELDTNWTPSSRHFGKDLWMPENTAYLLSLCSPLMFMDKDDEYLGILNCWIAQDTEEQRESLIAMLELKNEK